MHLKKSNIQRQIYIFLKLFSTTCWSAEYESEEKKRDERATTRHSARAIHTPLCIPPPVLHSWKRLIPFHWTDGRLRTHNIFLNTEKLRGGHHGQKIIIIKKKRHDATGHDCNRFLFFFCSSYFLHHFWWAVDFYWKLNPFGTLKWKKKKKENIYSLLWFSHFPSTSVFAGQDTIKSDSYRPLVAWHELLPMKFFSYISFD